MLQQCNKSIGQISKVIEEMLDMARISTGRIYLEKEEFYLCKFLSDLVKEIISLHEGQISIESELGKGAKFTISLPQ